MEQEIIKVENNINPFLNKEEPKAKGVIGNITIYFDKKACSIPSPVMKIATAI